MTVLFLSSFLFAQDMRDFMDEEDNSINGGFGVTWIDGQSYTTFTIAPELALGKFGVGLNVELLFNNDEGFKFRKDAWEDGAGALRMIRYLRWGLKHDPLYIRVGSLQTATLGHGFILGYYSNESNYDKRKIGLVFDLDLNTFGIETMSSNMGRLEVVGSRLYFRPLVKTAIPILKNFEVGGSYVADFDPDNRTATEDGIDEWGVDIGLPIIKTKLFTSTIYADYAKINNFGDGKAFGVKAGLPGLLGLFGIYAKLEKRFLSDQFLPNYFNTLYEIDRKEKSADYYKIENPAFYDSSLTKKEYLKLFARKTEGIYGELAGHILGKIRLLGSYQHINNSTNSGILHLEAKSNELIPGVMLRYTYDKVGIESFDDARTLDYRSVAVGEIGYRAYQFIYVTLQYRWNWIKVVDDKGKISYEPQERFQPSISFSMQF